MLDRVEWTKMPKDQADRIVEFASPVQGKHILSKETITVKLASLPFYDSITLLQVSDTALDNNVTPFWYLMNEDKLYLLDGSSVPIHDVNETVSIDLTSDTVEDYARFFCFFVHGDEGPFFIVEDSHFPAFNSEKMEFPMKMDLKKMCKPLEYMGKMEENTYKLSGPVLYGNALFMAQFAVTSNGMIEMIDDDPLLADIPCLKIKPNY